jgi:hypothetical protein
MDKLERVVRQEIAVHKSEQRKNLRWLKLELKRGNYSSTRVAANAIRDNMADVGLLEGLLKKAKEAGK